MTPERALDSTRISRTRQGGHSSDDSSPVLLLLHGAGATEYDLAALAAVAPGLQWASPRAPFDVGAGGAVWFRSRRPQPPDPDEVQASTRAIWNWIDQEIGSERRVIPIGFSQGGFMVLQLALQHPERIIAPTILSGLLLGDATKVHEPLTAVRPPLFWGRGQQDPVISDDEVHNLRTALQLHTRLHEHVYPRLGHGIAADEITDVAHFIQQTLDA